MLDLSYTDFSYMFQQLELLPKLGLGFGLEIALNNFIQIWWNNVTLGDVFSFKVQFYLIC